MNVIEWDGKPINSAGVFSGIPLDIYHDRLTVGPSVSKSGLWTLIDKSPAHYFVTSYLNPEREEQEDNEALILGSATHHLLLGEKEFSRHFAIRPEELYGRPWHGNRTDCKDWLAARAEENIKVVKGEDVVNIRGMSKACAKNALVKSGILNGLVEHSMVWQDKETGIWIKVRPDTIPTDALDFSDLKTARSVDDLDLERAVGDFGYHMQAGMVAMACRELFGRDLGSFSFVFVEKTKPWCVRVKTLRPEDIDLGITEAQAGLRIFKACLDKGEWPGVGGDQTDAEFIAMTPFKRKRIEDRLAVLKAMEERKAA